jgi:hypothetical protein
MKSYKTRYEKGDEDIWWDDSEPVSKEKRLRKIRWERRRRDKFGLDRHRQESVFRRGDL